MREFDSHSRRVEKRHIVKGTKYTVEGEGASLLLPATSGAGLARIEIQGNISQKKPTLIPSDYQQVEYIETTGTQYIDTGVVPNNYTRTFCDFQYTSDPVVGDYDYAVFGSRYSYNKQAYYVSFRGSHDECIYGVSGTFKTNQAFNDTERHIIDFAPLTGIYVDDELQFTMAYANFEGYSSMYIAGLNQPAAVAAVRTSKIKIYSAKIYQNDQLIRDFVPCYRKSDGEIGMYDLVNDAFYSNAGEGVLLKGLDATSFVDISPSHPSPIQNTIANIGCNRSALQTNAKLYGIGDNRDTLTIDWINKTVIKNKKIAQYTFTGDENILESTDSAGNKIYCVQINLHECLEARCTHFKYQNNGEAGQDVFWLTDGVVICNPSVDIRELFKTGKVQLAYVIDDIEEKIKIEPRELITLNKNDTLLEVTGASKIIATYYSNENEDTCSLMVSYKNENGDSLKPSDIHNMRKDSIYKLIPPKIEGHLPQKSEYSGYLSEDREITIIYYRENI